MDLTRTIALASLAVASACRIAPPPPLVPFHATTAPDERGSTSVMLVAGTATQLLFGGDGWGLALRVEHQETTHTALGLELSGGRGDQNHYEDGTTFRHWLVGVRGYGRYVFDGDPIALQYGIGASLAATGLVTGTLDGGAAAADNNTHAVPVVTLATALAVPLRSGRAFSTEPMTFGFGPPDPAVDFRAADPAEAFRQRRSHFMTPRTEIYLALGAGVVVPIGDANNRISLDVSFGKALREGMGIAAISVADRQRVAR